ncbi:MAG: 1-acyl-sn-glycerol-3-phosphate acyltransferase [Rhodocyclales bacterium]|jgi:1-acyl-sn-glycerol-3-phosphate acyltransferase|nr:MAG: 1-acyl-sn-glycerol-3-phosphate acyltransferase [Rhodocyclales bacterium]
MTRKAPRPTLPIILRSALFMGVLVVFTVPYALGVMLCFPLPHRWRRQSVVPWVHVASWLIKYVLGIDYRIVGRENIPDRPSVILSKHQSAWETIVLQLIFPWTLFVWKKELKMLPFFGWALAATPMISVDRGAGKAALQQLVDQGRMRLGQGYWVIIFPEGTRTPVGTHRRYKVGGAHLAVETGAPVVPVALNAGEFWSRRAFIKYPGTVTVSIGPAIDPAGLSAEDVSARAEAWMEAEMRRISPHCYEHHEPGGTAA